MNIAVYSGENPTHLQQLEAVIEVIAPEHQVTVYSDLEALRRRLYRPREHLKLAILKAVNLNELEGMVLLGNLLSDIRIVLILPDQEEATVSLAHRLHPRFLAWADGDWDVLKTVLGRIIRLYQ